MAMRFNSVEVGASRPRFRISVSSTPTSCDLAVLNDDDDFLKVFPIMDANRSDDCRECQGRTATLATNVDGHGTSHHRPASLNPSATQ